MTKSQHIKSHDRKIERDRIKALLDGLTIAFEEAVKQDRSLVVSFREVPPDPEQYRGFPKDMIPPLTGEKTITIEIGLRGSAS